MRPGIITCLPGQLAARAPVRCGPTPRRRVISEDGVTSLVIEVIGGQVTRSDGGDGRYLGRRAGEGWMIGDGC